MPKKVKVYGTATCPYCKRAKAWLEKQGIDFEDIDLSGDRSRIKEMIKISGQSGVPVIVIDDEVVIGFNRPRLEELLGNQDE